MPAIATAMHKSAKAIDSHGTVRRPPSPAVQGQAGRRVPIGISPSQQTGAAEMELG